MTRADAEQLIEDCATDAALRALAAHWLTNPPEGTPTEDIRAFLYDCIDENCIADRVTGPKLDDECDLTDPDAPPFTDMECLTLKSVAQNANLNSEQFDCLLDRSRSTEALGMLDDLQARIGIAGNILAPARAILRDISAPETPCAILCDLLRAWQDLQGLPNECADDQRTMRTDLSTVQRAWLDAYCTLWECNNDC